MPCPFNSVRPATQLSVFISSAQKDENGFKWGDIRRQVKEQLEKCPYVLPFIIENTASEIPSGQFFEYRVLQANIVVMMIKGELRPGTNIEFTVATKNRKPLLIYFLKDQNPSSDVIRLRKAVQESDYCTYRDMDTFEDIAKIVQNDVIANMIQYYQYNHFTKSNIAAEPAIELSPVAKENTLSKYDTPTKTSIGLFSSSYAHIFELLGFHSASDALVLQSPLHSFGVAAIDWLVTGKPIDYDAEFRNLITHLDDVYDSTEWLANRGKAIQYELSGNTHNAIIAAKEALSIAKEKMLPQWIINDILVDCRNLENELITQKREWINNSEFQKELSGLDTIVCFPVLDRYLADINGSLAKDEFRFQTASPDSMLYGTSLDDIINNIVNYFFIAVLYGSYTHIMKAREILSRVLYKYSELTKDTSLLLSSITLLVIQGNSQYFEKLLDYKWDSAYAEIVTRADEIWALTNLTVPSRRKSIKQTVIAKMGLYLTEHKFEEAQCFLEEISPTIYWGTAEKYFESINQNMCRLDCARVMHMLTGILRDQRFHLGGKLASVILQMEINNVDIETQTKFCNALKERLPFIVQNGGTPQIIAVLAKQSPIIFSSLSTVSENGLTGIEKIQNVKRAV